jgi:hypothetical protein
MKLNALVVSDLGRRWFDWVLIIKFSNKFGGLGKKKSWNPLGNRFFIFLCRLTNYIYYGNSNQLLGGWHRGGSQLYFGGALVWTLVWKSMGSRNGYEYGGAAGAIGGVQGYVANGAG